MLRIVLSLLALFAASPALAQSTITYVQPAPSAGQVIYLNGNQNLIRPTGNLGYDLGRAAGYASNGFPNNNVTILRGGGSGGTVQTGANGINIYNDNGKLTGTYQGGRYTPAP